MKYSNLIIMGAKHSTIKAYLLIESENNNLFMELCKFIHSVSDKDEVECIYNVNKDYIILRNNLSKNIYKSVAYFNVKKFKTLILIWKTLCSWKKLLKNDNVNFKIKAIRKGVSYLIFENEVFNRFKEKPIGFDLSFFLSKKINVDN